jgi:hypothetical protein
MARKSSNPRYAGEREYPQISFEGGLPHRIMFWFNPGRDEAREVSFEYQVFVRGSWVALTRYAGGKKEFWRYKPSWPTPGDREQNLGDIPIKQRRDAVIDDVQRHARDWQRLIPTEERE